MVQTYLIAIFALIMVGAIIREQAISRRLSARGSPVWQQVLYQLKAVRTQGLREVASRSSSSELLADETASALSRIGGEEGLRRLLHNSPVIVNLARCSVDWRSSEGVAVPAVAKIRRIDLRLRLLTRVSAVLVKLGASEGYVSTCLQGVASMYCEMVDQLIRLYSEAHAARVDQLVAACNW